MSVFYTWTSMCARKKWHELKSCRCNNFDDVSQTKWSASEKGKNTCFWILMFFWRDVLLFQAALSKTVLKLYIFCPFVIPTRWHIRAAAAGGTFRRFVASSLRRPCSVTCHTWGAAPKRSKAKRWIKKGPQNQKILQDCGDLMEVNGIMMLPPFWSKLVYKEYHYLGWWGW